MKPEVREQADAYFAEAKSWAVGQNQALHRSRRIAWIVACAASTIALVEGLSLLVLMPLKTVVPYTLLVDRQTGYVQRLDPLKADTIAPDTALTQSFLVQYVLAREGFDYATVQDDYRRVLLWSGDSAERDYAAFMPLANPASPLATVPPGGSIDARIRSVSSLGGHTALVRFETTRLQRGGAPIASQDWVAVIEYRFINQPMSAEDRFTNPLGFQVMRYRRNAETMPVASEQLNSTGATAFVPLSAAAPVSRAKTPSVSTADRP